jgi:hypothetical protein
METKVIFSGKSIDKPPNKRVSVNKPKPSGTRRSKTKFEDIDLTSSIGDIYRKSRNRHSKTPSASVKQTAGKDAGASGNTANKYYKNSNRDTTVERDKNESKLIRIGTSNQSNSYTRSYTSQQPSSRIAPRSTRPSTRPITRTATRPATRPIAPPITRTTAPPITRTTAPPIAQPVTRPVAPPIAQPIAPPIAQPATRPVAPPIAPPINNNMRTTINRVNPPINNNIGNQTYVKTNDISGKQSVVQKSKPVISKKPIRPTSSLGKPVISKKPIKPLSIKVYDVDNNDSRDSVNVPNDSLGDPSMNKYTTVRVKTDLNSFKKTTEYVDWDVYNSNAVQLEHFKRLSSIEDKYLTKLISQGIIINKIDSD